MEVEGLLFLTASPAAGEFPVRVSCRLRVEKKDFMFGERCMVTIPLHE
jgi:hypothetical protein